MTHPASAIIWGRCARCNGSEEDHERLKDLDRQEWFLCPTAFIGPDHINWDLTYDEIKTGDEIG